MTSDSPSPLPRLGAATLLRALFKRPRRLNGVRTPRTAYVLDRIDPGQLRRYRQALGFRDEGIPVTYVPARNTVLLSLAPGAKMRRPLQRSPIANLLLAGAWTDTGWPANLESAVSSGERCAEIILRHGIRGN